MFERFTDPARRAIFFARQEAEQNRHKQIETTDLLSGLAQEWSELCEALPLNPRSREPRKRRRAQRKSPQKEISFSDAAKKAFVCAVRYAEETKSASITTRHLLVGLAREDARLARLFARRRVDPKMLPSPEGEERERGAAGLTRVGLGYDYHRLVEGRKLVLGGVEVPFAKGLAGHSDGDVLTHALCDALLGAAALGDLGQHFPDTDPQWKDASSLELLARVVKMLADRGLRVAQVDTVVMAQEPKLAPHFSAMREALARALGVEPAQVNVKAKTTEGLEAVGRGEAMAAQAIVLVEKREEEG